MKAWARGEESTERVDPPQDRVGRHVGHIVSSAMLQFNLILQILRIEVNLCRGRRDKNVASEVMALINRLSRFLLPAFSLALAAGIWLPLLHLFFRPALGDFRRAGGVAPQTRRLASRQLALWEDPARRAGEISRMRASNAEWDFMGRTYFVLALANMALREPAEEGRYLSVMDAIIDETIATEQSKGIYFFMMDYAKAGNFLAQPPRSTFLDGEIAMMLAARQMVRAQARYAPLLAQRVDLIESYLSRGPVMCGESYPDECWMFCNAVAVAAVRVSDRLDGRDHSAFIGKWLATVKAKLVHKESGLLVSSFTYDGRPKDGPEGSSIWMVAHCLKVVDPEFAAEQYRLARGQIGKEVLGFGYAREWPPSWEGTPDVDSGPIVPVLNASAGSSGLAILGAASFDDDAYLRELLTTLRFAGFPTSRGGELRFAASNQVGDAVLLYAMVQGPLWERAMGKPEKH
jgi:hypothetical protein